MKKETQGMVTISRVQSSTEGTFVRIQIQDRVSGTTVATVNMSFEEFGNAVTGLYGCEGELTVYDTDNVGKIRQHKTIQIAVPKFLSGYVDEDQQLAKDLLTPYEVDGWSGYVTDMFNSYKTSMKDDTRYQSVSFSRYVDPESVDECE